MSDWVRVALEKVPEGGSKGLEAVASDGSRHALLAVRKNGRLYVYRNHCPHTGVNLEWMPDEFLDYERTYLQCAMHGALFAIEDGLCLRGPCLGRRLQTVPLARRDDGWYVDLAA